VAHARFNKFGKRLPAIRTCGTNGAHRPGLKGIFGANGAEFIHPRNKKRAGAF